MRQSFSCEPSIGFEDNSVQRFNFLLFYQSIFIKLIHKQACTKKKQKVGQKIIHKLIPEDGQTERHTGRKFYSKIDFFTFSTKHFDKILNLSLRFLLQVNKAKKW